MSVREEYFFTSKDDRGTRIHAVKWTPEDGRVRSVLQICHGMQEYIDRYQEFADFMTDNGFAVVGHDHIGHGGSVTDVAELGIMHASDPAEVMVEDILTNYGIIREQFPEVPVFILGHSMGSYLLRRLLSEKADALQDLSGAIIMGTGTEKDGTIKAGRAVVNLLAAFHGWDYKSKFVAGLMFGKPYRIYNTDGTDPGNSWLSKNVENVRAYYKNPLDNYMFSLNGYRVLLDCTLYDNQPENIALIRKDLPILFTSGAEDPVGNMGQGVREACDRFRQAGIRDVSIRLYEGDRHEILNETDRDRVYNDILGWLLSKMKG